MTSCGRGLPRGKCHGERRRRQGRGGRHGERPCALRSSEGAALGQGSLPTVSVASRARGRRGTRQGATSFLIIVRTQSPTDHEGRVEEEERRRKGPTRGRGERLGRERDEKGARVEQRSDSGGGEGQVAEKRDTDAKRPQRREKTEEGQSREEPMRRNEDRDEEGHEEQRSALEETRSRSRGWGMTTGTAILEPTGQGLLNLCGVRVSSAATRKAAAPGRPCRALCNGGAARVAGCVQATKPHEDGPPAALWRS